MSGSKQLESELRKIIDRAEITDVVNRYVRGLGSNDSDMVASCFADDAMLDLSYVKLQGVEAIRAFYSKRSRPGIKIAGSPIQMDRRVSTPYNANIAIDLQGDTAHCESSCLAIHAGTKGSAEVVLMRGTHNSDDLVRTPGGWKIRRRVHSTQWAAELPGVPTGH
jgi:ketosteroid isomerase-like protein